MHQIIHSLHPLSIFTMSFFTGASDITFNCVDGQGPVFQRIEGNYTRPNGPHYSERQNQSSSNRYYEPPSSHYRWPQGGRRLGDEQPVDDEEFDTRYGRNPPHCQQVITEDPDCTYTFYDEFSNTMVTEYHGNSRTIVNNFYGPRSGPSRGNARQRPRDRRPRPFQADNDCYPTPPPSPPLDDPYSTYYTAQRTTRVRSSGSGSTRDNYSGIRMNPRNPNRNGPRPVRSFENERDRHRHYESHDADFDPTGRNLHGFSINGGTFNYSSGNIIYHPSDTDLYHEQPEPVDRRPRRNNRSNHNPFRQPRFMNEYAQYMRRYQYYSNTGLPHDPEYPLVPDPEILYEDPAPTYTESLKDAPARIDEPLPSYSRNDPAPLRSYDEQWDE
ncbi:hypothetical protein GYMLUDRAFT_263891 [Collybiopsis luxurians FD-317 M1]|uniref:Uncharacterized protein n=1 Tax=Collybiopsis luxurians FD-317 M1 TaxID=944289 RepID=A0A0D0CLF9_9AGAR|nr:hypothetical protein GYMLUDRAFT_263891 [Collybiopsis luxurians FD-317 M1]